MYTRDNVALRPNVFVDGETVSDPDWFRIYQWDYRGHLALHLKTEETVMPDDYRVRKALGPYHGVSGTLKRIQKLMEDPQAGAAVREAFPYLEDSRLEGMDLRDITAMYYGMVTCVDEYLGRLIDLLEAEGIAEDTLVVFTSDHGDNLGSHHLWMKDRLYEESIRIPLLFRWPGGLEPRDVAAQVGSLVDVAPTVASLLGLAPPSAWQGEDLSPVLRGDAETAGENLAFIETWRHQAIGVRTPGMMYGAPMLGEEEAAWEPDDNPESHLCYDLGADPYQQENLAPCEATSHLGERLLRWHRETPRRPVPAPTLGASKVSIY
jgi:arylsulfatase A-like enzyme